MSSCKKFLLEDSLDDSYASSSDYEISSPDSSQTLGSQDTYNSSSESSESSESSDSSLDGFITSDEST